MNEKIISRIDTLKVSINAYGKLKNGIKNLISDKLSTVSRFIKCGPGVVNEANASKSLGEVKSLLNVWVKDSEVLKYWFSEINIIKTELFPSKNELLEELAEQRKEEENILLSKRELVIESEEVLEKPITTEMSRRYRSLFPESLEKLDIVYVSVGVIPHYCIVYKVMGDITYVLSITSNKKKEYFGHIIEKSRFWSGSTAVFTLHQIPTKLAMSMYVMPFDSKSEGNQILRECTEFLTKSILIKSRRRKK